MTGDYPRFKTTHTHEDLRRALSVKPADHAVIDTRYGDANRHGVAVLLKSIQYLGYFPADLQQVPQEIRTFIAHQLELLWDHTGDYPWHSSTRDRHLRSFGSIWAGAFPPARTNRAPKSGSGSMVLLRPPPKQTYVNAPMPGSRDWALSCRPNRNSSGLCGQPFMGSFTRSISEWRHSSQRRSARASTNCWSWAQMTRNPP